LSVTILVVDDEEPVRNMTCLFLKKMGYETIQAQNGEEGLEKAASTPCDLVLTDMKMPQMNGLDMAQHLLAADPDRPVLLMTAFADLDSARQALKIGIYDYFQKPFDINDFMVGIKRALEHRRLVLEVQAYQHDLERKVEERTRELNWRVRELEARDSLLCDLFSLDEPETLLTKSVELALGLCGANIGRLHFRNDSGIYAEASVGFAQEIEKTALIEIETAVEEVWQSNNPLDLVPPEIYRALLGINTLALLPIKRGDSVVGVLEMGHTQLPSKDNQTLFDQVKPFLPYIAMTIHECHLQEKFPDWSSNLETLLNETNKWTEN
jgi:DNA-binding response OmpR family regulator